MSNEEMVEQIRQGAGDRQELLYELYKRNRGLIFKTVSPYITQGTEEQDAMQEAFIGLWEAVEHYAPDRGAFTSCLCFWVRSVVGRWQQDTGHTKRIPAHMQERMQKYLRICQEYQAQTGQQPSDVFIRGQLGISQEQLQDVRQYIRERDPVSLSDPVSGAEDLTIEGTVPDLSVDVEQEAIDDIDRERDALRLWEAVDALPDKQPEILRIRYQEQKTMRATGEALGVSADTVRRSEDYALRRLRKNRTVKQIGESQGYTSKVYRGGLSRFRISGSSVVEEIIMRKLDPDAG